MLQDLYFNQMMETYENLTDLSKNVQGSQECEDRGAGDRHIDFMTGYYVRIW
jgi:hypothetical protein